MLTYKGREFDGDEFQKDMLKDVVKVAVTQFQKKLNAHTCSEHSKRPEVLDAKIENDKLKFNIKFCCKEFEEATSKNF